MERVIVYIGTFLIVYLVYLIFVISRSKQKEYRKSTEALYLEKVYKVNISKINVKKLAYILSLTNAFIIANVILIIDFINNYFAKTIVGFLITIPMILVTYHILAYILKRGEK